MARGMARRQEMSVRAAIGASRGRLIRQLLVESELIALLGAMAGFAIATWIFKLLAARVPQGSLHLLPDAPDARALAFAIASALVCGAVLGVVPALRVSKADLDGAWRGRLRLSGPSARRAGAALVTAEVALGLVLLCGAALMTNSLVRAQTVDLGYEPSRTLALSVFPPVARYPTTARRYAYWMTLLEQVRSVPGVESAGAIDYLQVGGVGPPRALGTKTPARNGGLWSVTPEYFAVMQMPIVEGRTFTPREAVGDAPVALVNQTAARFFWPDNRDVVGRVLRLDKQPPLQVIGVVKDARYGYGRDASLSVYRPSGPDQRLLTIVARVNGDPSAVAALMRTAAQRIDPRIVIRLPRTIESVLQQGQIADTRFQTTLFVLFAVLGCCLTAIGVYGIVGYWVSGRTQEMGIRLALGAHPRRLQRLVLTQAARPLVTGAALGLAGAFVLTRQLQSLLFGITAHDPITLASATVLLLIVGLAAAWLPARQASRVDPLAALKAE
jgi:predicted permease